MSGMLPKIGATARSVFGDVDKVVERTQGKLRALGDDVKIKVDTSGLGQAHEDIDELRRKLNNLGDGGPGIGKIAGGAFLGEMMMHGMERAFDYAREQVKDVFGEGMELEHTKLLMKVVKRNDAAGQELFEDVHANLLHSLYGTQLYGVGKGLTTSGMGTDEVMKRMGQFEDIAGGNAGNMDQFLQSYIHIRGTGEANYHMLQPLIGMGFNPAEILKEKHGGSLQHWNDELLDTSKGLKLFNEALDLATSKGGMFFEAQKRLMETPGGKYILQKTNLENTRAEFGEKLMPAMGGLFDAIKPIVSQLPDALERMVPAIEKGIEGFEDMLPKLEDFGGALLDVLKPIGGFLLSDDVRGIGKDLFETAANLFHAAQPAVDLFVKGLEGANYILKPFADAVARLGHKSADEKFIAGMTKAVIWTANDSLEQAGYKVDSAALKKMREGNGLLAADFTSYNALDSFNRKMAADGRKEMQLTDAVRMSLPYLRDKDNSPNKKSAEGAGAAALNDASNAIVGGGPKQTILHFHAPLYQVQHQVLQTVQDAIRDFKEGVRQAMWEILPGLPG